MEICRSSSIGRSLAAAWLRTRVFRAGAADFKNFGIFSREAHWQNLVSQGQITSNSAGIIAAKIKMNFHIARADDNPRSENNEFQKKQPGTPSQTRCQVL